MSKDISSLSKRRKNQLLNAQIARYLTDHNQPSTSHTTPLSHNYYIDRVSPLNHSITNKIHNDQLSSASSMDFDTPTITQSNVLTHTDDAANIGTNVQRKREVPYVSKLTDIHQVTLVMSPSSKLIVTIQVLSI